MFKFLKKKYKRSDWMEGLLLAEQYKDYSREEIIGIFSSTDYVLMENNGKRLPVQTFKNIQFGRGVLDYISHKKYLESLDK